MFKRATCSKFVILFLTGLVTLIIAACGGGSGGVGGGGETPPGTNYTGVTTQAFITEENAEDLLLGAYRLGQAYERGTPAMGLSLEPTTVLGPSRSQATADSLTAFMARIELTGSGHYPVARQVNPDSQTIDGNCDGSAKVTVSLDEDTGDFNGSAIFYDYCQDGITMSGEATINGRIQESGGNIFYESYNMTFTNLSFRSGPDAFTMIGDINFSFPSPSDPSNAIVSITMNLRLRDDNTALIYKVDNLVHDFTIEGNFLALSTEGIYYDPIHGYVALDTPVTIKFMPTDDWPSGGGVLRAQGLDNTWARMIFDGNGTTRIEMGPGT